VAGTLIFCWIAWTIWAVYTETPPGADNPTELAQLVGQSVDERDASALDALIKPKTAGEDYIGDYLEELDRIGAGAISGTYANDLVTVRGASHNGTPICTTWPVVEGADRWYITPVPDPILTGCAPAS